MKALEHMKQELAEHNQLQRQAREEHKPGFGDLEIADAEVESQHKDPALKAVGGHEDKGLEDKRIANLDKHETKTTIECEDYIKPSREECDPNTLLQLELEHIKVEQDKSQKEEELKKIEGKLDDKIQCVREAAEELVRKDFGGLQVANIDREDKLGQHRPTKPNVQSLTLDSVVDVRMATAKEQTLTFTKIRVMASEKQPEIRLDQKRSSFVRDFDYLLPIIQFEPGQGSGKREENDLHYLD